MLLKRQIVVMVLECPCFAIIKAGFLRPAWKFRNVGLITIDRLAHYILD